MKGDPDQLWKEQIDSFRKYGYACLRSFFAREVVANLREMSDQMSSQAMAILESCRAAGVSLADRAKSEPLELIVVPEVSSPNRVCRYECMIKSKATFNKFVTACLEPIVSEIVGEPVVPFKDKTNEKLPGGGAFRPHQDFAAYRAFQPRYHATALLTIDPASIANGCVQFATNCEELIAAKNGCVIDAIQGKALLTYYDGGICNGDIRSEIAEDLRWEPLQTDPTDLVIFDSFIPHYSDVNKSNRPRRAIFVTFSRASEGSFYDAYYNDKRSHYDDPKFHVSTPTAHRDIAKAVVVR